MMLDHTKGLKEYAKKKTKITLEKVDKAINELSLQGKKINFNSISNLSGVSKTFMYKNAKVKKMIEQLRYEQNEKFIKSQLKYSNIDKSRDIVIISKDRRIKELEYENEELKKQLEMLRKKVY